MAKARAVTAADFDNEVLRAEVPVLVDFWAPWCPPCRAVGPEVDAVAEAMEGRAKVLKLDVDEEPEIESQYGVRSIPTLLFFKDGRVADQIVGAVPRGVIAEKLHSLL